MSQEELEQQPVQVEDGIEETPATEEGVPRGTEGGDEEPEAAAAPEEPVYEPNYKLTVMDEEREIPEEFRQLITDTDSEQRVREVFEKAYGLEHAKPKHEETQKSYETVQGEYKATMDAIQSVRDSYQSKDFDNFFKKLDIPQEEVLKWVVDKVQYQELPAEQRQALDRQRTSDFELHSARRQNEQLQRDVQEQVSQAKGYALQAALDRADIKEYADAYDGRVGKSGSFRTVVIQQGDYVWRTEGKDLPAHVAIERAMSLLGPSVVETVVEPVVAAPKVIPNVSGRSASPARESPKSLADLKRMHDEM